LKGVYPKTPRLRKSDPGFPPGPESALCRAWGETSRAESNGLEPAGFRRGMVMEASRARLRERYGSQRSKVRSRRSWAGGERRTEQNAEASVTHWRCSKTHMGAVEWKVYPMESRIRAGALLSDEKGSVAESGK